MRLTDPTWQNGIIQSNNVNESLWPQLLVTNHYVIIIIFLQIFVCKFVQ